MQRGEASPPPIGRLLGFVLKGIEPGRAVFEMEADERPHNPLGTVLGGVSLCSKFGARPPGGKGMNDTRFTVDHVCRTTDKPFEDVTTAFVRQLGRFEPDVYKALASGSDAEGARARIEAMAGPSGF